MNLKDKFSRERLYNRHHFSHQQIDSLFHEESGSLLLPGKISQIGLLSELLELSDIFSAAGLSFIPLKGPVLSWRLYGDATYRSCGDLDILVDIKSLEEAVKLLEARNYIPGSFSWPADKRGQALVNRHCHHILMHNAAKEITIELHWRLFRTTPVSFQALEDIVNANLVPLELNGRSFRVLSPEMELLYLIIHGGIHFWNQLRWLTDVDQLLQIHKIDWGKFDKLVSKLKAGRLTALYGSLSIKLLTDPAPIRVNASAQPFLVKCCLKEISEEFPFANPSLKEILMLMRYQYSFFSGFRYRREVILSYIFPEQYIGKTRFFRSAALFYSFGIYLRISNLIKHLVGRSASDRKISHDKTAL